MCAIQQSPALIAEGEEFCTSPALRHNSCSWHGMWWVCLREVWWLQVYQKKKNKLKKNNKQKKATHTLTPLHKFAKMHLCRIMPLHFLSLILCTPYHTRGKLLCSKSVTLFSAARQHHA